MLQTANERLNVVPQRIVCRGDRDVRMLASEYRGSATSIVVTPSKSSVMVTTSTTAVAFECDQAIGDRSLMLANILVGLGCFRNTSAVPSHLTNPLVDSDTPYVVAAIH